MKNGSTASSYVPHQEQIVNFPLSSGQVLHEGDFLADDGVHSVRGPVVLDESITLIYNGAAGQFYTTNQHILPNYKSNTQIYSDYFLYSATTWKKNCLGITSNNVFWLYIENGPTNLTDLRTWLSTHNTIVEYELEEPTITPYTQEQQTAWEQIKALYSYNEQTNISQDGDLPFKLDITALVELS